MPLAFRYEIKPTVEQQNKMFEILRLCRRLYNSALEERKTAWENEHKSITYSQQQNDLPTLKNQNPEFMKVHAQVLQDVLRRLDTAYTNFFEKRAGYPHFKSRDYYSSFTYPQVDNVAKTFSAL